MEYILVEKIKANPYQPRTIFSERKINVLAKSIRDVGLKNPILVGENPDGSYTLKDGERRLRAIKKLGIEKLKVGDDVIIKKATDKELMVDGFILNLMRENLKPAEKGRAFFNILKTIGIDNMDVAINVINRAKDYKDNGILSEPSKRNYYIPKETVLQVLDYLGMIGISGTNAVSLLKILELPKDIQEATIFAPPNMKMVFETRVSKRGRKGKKRIKLPDKERMFISVRHAEHLSRIKDDKVIKFLFQKIVKDGWGSTYLGRVVDDFINSHLTGEDYFKYIANKKKKSYDTSVSALTRNMNDFASTLTSFRTINLVQMVSDFKKKEFIISGMGLRESSINLKEALDQILLSAKELLKEKKNSKKELKEIPFTIAVQTPPKDREQYRFNLPKEIAEKLELKPRDMLTLKIVSIRKLSE